jgi:acyl-CoA synthetase (AMP-forming)/AMP-acid ligase II
MPTELDRRIDHMIGAVTGPGGPIQIAKDEQGRAIVANLPPTLPMLFDVFCGLHGDAEAVVADDERLSFKDLAAHANRLAPVLVGGFGIEKGDRVAIAMRNCPSWIISYMAVVKAGGIATLLNGWWTPSELTHALTLSEPKLVIADGPRGERVTAAGYGGELVTLPVDRPLDEALAPLLGRGGEGASLPQVGPDDYATILFTSGSTGNAKGALSTHRAVTSGVYNYSMQLAVMSAVLESSGGKVPEQLRTLVNVPLFHVTGEVPVMLNSFVIKRCMVLMRKWDPGEALRLIEQERITYFVGVPTMSLELMQHPDRDKYDLSTLTTSPRRRSAPGRSRAAAQGQLQDRAAGDRLWPHRDQRGRAAATSGPIMRRSPIRPDARASRSWSWRSSARMASISRRRARARSRSARREHPCYWRDPRRPRGLHRRPLPQDRRHRLSRRGQLPVHRRPQEGHHHPRRREYLLRGSGSRHLRARAVAEASVFGVPCDRLGEQPMAAVHLKDGQDVSADTIRETWRRGWRRSRCRRRSGSRPSPCPSSAPGKIDKVSLRAAYADAVR